MDNGEILQQFVGMTGADTDFALSFLEANAWDLESAINLYLEGNYGGNIGNVAPKAAGGAEGGTRVSPPLSYAKFVDEQGGGSEIDPRTLADEEMARAMSDIPPEMYENNAMYDEEGVRAPIMPKSEVLVEDDPFIRHAQSRLRPQRPTGEANVFDMFRDYRHESMLARGGEDQSTKKIKTLADLFRPPVDLMEPGTFENVKNIANQRKKWLLVNIQEVAEFDCQKMNRDTWSDPAVKSVVRSNFVLWQVLKPSEEGMRYCRFYPIDLVPHIAIIDSRTGERLDVREGFIEPKDLVIVLENFLRNNSLEDTAPTKPRAESPKKLGDLSEEAQLAAAVAASLGKAIDDIPPTPFTPPPTKTSTTTTTTTSTPTPKPTPSSTSTYTSTPAPATPTPTPTSTPAPTQSTTTPTTSTTSTQPKEDPQASANLRAEHSNQSAECSCVIQIRMPNETIKGFFRPTDTLRTVHQYVNLHLEPKKEFNLVTTFPKKTYSGDLLGMTLKEADLVPRAVLICEVI